jgi:hypothetical protein
VRERHSVKSSVSQLEKVRLRSIAFAVPKVAQGDANQPETLLWLKVYPLSQLQRDVRQLLAGRGR